jgi:hypothetical protein
MNIPKRRRNFVRRKEVAEVEIMWLLIRSDLIVFGSALLLAAVVYYSFMGLI